MLWPGTRLVSQTQRSVPRAALDLQRQRVHHSACVRVRVDQKKKKENAPAD